MENSKEAAWASNGSAPGQLFLVSRLAFSAACAFASVVFLALECKVILHFVRHGTRGSALGSLGPPLALLMPLITLVLALGGYRNIRRVVLQASDGPAVLQVVAFNGLMVLGFAFLTMELLL